MSSPSTLKQGCGTHFPAASTTRQLGCSGRLRLGDQTALTSPAQQTLSLHSRKPRLEKLLLQMMYFELYKASQQLSASRRQALQFRRRRARECFRQWWLVARTGPRHEARRIGGDLGLVRHVLFTCRDRPGRPPRGGGEAPARRLG